MAGEIGASAIQMGTQIVDTLINQAFAEHNRKRNFYWNEKVADNADQRQRAQYRDLYSPQAQMEQYAAAGLSPSMMMSGGQSAVGGTPQGAQGGLNGPYPGGSVFDPLAAAEIMLKKAQTRNLDEDTTTKELANELQTLKNSTFKNEWKLLNITTGGDERGLISISDLVNSTKDYLDFKKKAITKWNLDDEMQMFLNSEEGNKALRNIYEANKEFSNEIAVLENSQENAELMLGITKLLNNNDFISKSAESQKQELEKLIEDSKLTSRQRQAFNNLLDKMGENTWTDIAIVLLTIVGQYSHANLNVGTARTESIIHKD